LTISKVQIQIRSGSFVNKFLSIKKHLPEAALHSLFQVYYPYSGNVGKTPDPSTYVYLYLELSISRHEINKRVKFY